MDVAPEFRRYGLATLGCALALVAASATDAPAPCFLLAVVVSGLYWGKGPGLWCTALSALAGAFFLLSPETYLFVESSWVTQLGAFAAAALATVWLLEGRRRVEADHRLGATGTRAEITEQKSEHRFRSFINTIPQLAWAAGPDGSADFLNQSWVDYTGLSVEKTGVWNWTGAVHPEDLNALVAYWQSLMTAGKSGQYRARLRRFDGVYRWFLFSFSPFYDESGTLAAWYGTNVDIEDRKRAEEELQRSQEMHRIVIETASDAVVSMDESGAILLANPATGRIFGYDLAELIGAPLTILMPEYLRQVHDAGVRRYLATGQRHLNWQGTEVTGLRKNGQEFPVEVSFGEMNSRGQKIFTGFIRDITGKKHAEEALRASERDLSSIINTIPILAWSARPDGFCDFINLPWLEFTGLTAENARGWGWGSAIHPEDVPRLADFWQTALASGERVDVEARMRRFDGEYRWFLFRANPLRDESGAIVKWYGTNTDIDDRKRAEEALLSKERSLRQIVDSIPGLVCTMDPAGQIQLLNRQVLEYFGRTVEELKHWGNTNAVHPDDSARVREAFLSSIETGRPYDIEHRCRRADGQYRWFHVRALPVRDGENRVTGWYVLLVDVDDRKHAEETLRNTEARLSRATRIATVGELSASIAHEVNQPLAAVVASGHACVRFLSAQPPNVAKAHEAAESIVRDGKEAGEVVRRIRALFQRAAVEKVMLNLNDVIGEVLRLLASESGRKQVTMEIDLKPDLPLVPGDRLQLQQVLLNLLLNGMEAMDSVHDRSRRITVRSTQESSDAVLVAVQDNGAGLENPEKVFEAFVTTKPNGMGMGLTICRSIVEAHNGRLWAMPGKGPGTTFCLSLPLRMTE